MNILQNLKLPAEIKTLSPSALAQLGQELRDYIISVVAQNGGHLSPNLGVVELTLALFRVFDFPQDKIVWDVGHQAYAYKILSDRKEKFTTLRQKGGISGFPKRSESIYDHFGVGHASTSLSAALGMAIARDLNGDDYKVIGVIGDGSLTGGEAFEALNNIGSLQKNILVILNDNEMSIAKNVGAISQYLATIRTMPRYNQLKKDVGKLLNAVPHFGDRLYKKAESIKTSLKNAISEGCIFEELGLNYIGPLDGNDLPQLIEVLEKVKLMEGPILLHVCTQKGKGYLPAEQKPDCFHGIGKFNIADGSKVVSADNVPTYTAVFAKTLENLAAEDEDIVAITAAMPDGTGLKQFAKLYPKRFFDVGIAEEHAFTMAAGLATQGKKPVVAVYSTFAQRAYDQILHDICLQNLPVVMCLDRGGLVGEDGPTHHGVFDYSFLRNIPNIVLLAPKDEDELQIMLQSAFTYARPVAIRYPRGKALGVKLEKREILPLGQAEYLRQGGNILIWAIGSMVRIAEMAAEILAKEGIYCSVVNARFVKPLDEKLLLETVKRSRCLITLEENVLAGGFGSAILETLVRHQAHHLPIYCYGIPDCFVGHGKTEALLEDLALTAPQIADKIRKIAYNGNGLLDK